MSSNLLKMIIRMIPQLGDGIRWIQQHIMASRFLTKNNKLIIVLEFDTEENLEKAESILRKIFYSILQR